MTAEKSVLFAKSSEVEAQIACGCHTEKLVVSLWKDEPYPTEVYFSMWYLGRCEPGNNTWRHRWKLIKRIITKGEPYLDQVTATEAQARELGEWLIEHTRREL